MLLNYQSADLAAPASIKNHLNKVTVKDYKELTETVGKQKMAIIIYHKPSRAYFAGMTTDVRKYFGRMFEEMALQSIKVPGVVMQFLKKSKGNLDSFEFFYYHLILRNQVENALADAGYRRELTTMGSLINKRHVIFEVHSKHFNITRYVSCAEDSDPELIRSKADKSMVDWLRRPILQHKRDMLRVTFRFELQSDVPSIFKKDHCDIGILQRSLHIDQKFHRAEVERLNQIAVDTFIQRTTGGRY